MAPKKYQHRFMTFISEITQLITDWMPHLDGTDLIQREPLNINHNNKEREKEGPMVKEEEELKTPGSKAVDKRVVEL